MAQEGMRFFDCGFCSEKTALSVHFHRATGSTLGWSWICVASLLTQQKGAALHKGEEGVALFVKSLC